jgi:2',3'-cyclic-nucleotide 2'-phosphodiesterase (5'-nucleotidase family)
MSNRHKHKVFAPLLLLVLLLVGCNKVWHTADHKHAYYRISAMYDTHVPGEQTKSDSIIGPYRQQMEAEMGKVIGSVEKRLSKGAPESLLSNWFGDMIYRQSLNHHSTPPDFAFMNAGGIRLPEMAEGELVVGKIYELMPFDNFLVIVSMSGYDVQKLFNFIGTKRGGWPVSSQIRAVYNNSGEITHLTIDGKELDSKKIYQVATSNFLADGGDNLDFMVPLQRISYPVFIRDMMIDDVKHTTSSGKPVSAELDGRIVIKQ